MLFSVSAWPTTSTLAGAVAGVAHHAGHADVAVAARHRRLVRMHGHALQRAVAGRMAVHAARMLDDLAGLLEQRDGARRLVGDAVEADAGSFSGDGGLLLRLRQRCDSASTAAAARRRQTRP